MSCHKDKKVVMRIKRSEQAELNGIKISTTSACKRPSNVLITYFTDMIDAHVYLLMIERSMVNLDLLITILKSHQHKGPYDNITLNIITMKLFLLRCLSVNNAETTKRIYIITYHKLLLIMMLDFVKHLHMN